MIQQKQGRVQATARVNGMAVNDEERLEREADLGQIPVQRKAGTGTGTEEVVQAITGDGHLGDRNDTQPMLLYNKNEFRWIYFLADVNQRDGQAQNASMHHIIPLETLAQFWDIIVDYYPDLWGGMVKKILENVRKTFKSGKGYQNYFELNFLGTQNNIDIEKEIDQEAQVFQNRAFTPLNEPTSLTNNMVILNNLIGTVYSWMSGNLVIGPTNRSDDRHMGFDPPALQQKKVKLKKSTIVKQFESLHDLMRAFIDRGDHQKRKAIKINGSGSKEDREEAHALETTALEIVDKIAILLAGQNSTNSTVWNRVRDKYTSRY